jgi:hypothetical protein
MAKAEVHTESGFNLERALDQHLPGELRAAEKVVAEIEAKLNTARERLYRLRAIAQSAGLKVDAEPAPAAAEEPPREP